MATKYSSHSEIIEMLFELCEIVEPTQKINAVKEDETDNRVLECAIEAHARYIISGDKHLLGLKTFQGIEIVNASQLLKKFQE